MRLLLVLLSLALVTESGAQERVLARCGPSSGWSHFVTGPDRGWTKDGILKGSVTIVRKRDGYDVVITDATTTFSAREDGAAVTLVAGGDADRIILAATYPLGTVESYQLTFVGTTGTLVWSSVKNSLVGPKGSLFVAECRRS